MRPVIPFHLSVFLASVARQPRVPGRMDVARAHQLAGMKARSNRYLSSLASAPVRRKDGTISAVSGGVTGDRARRGPSAFQFSVSH